MTSALLVVAITMAQHARHGWTEGEIVSFMARHPNRAYFSRLFRDGGMRVGMEVGVADGRFSEHFLKDAGKRIRNWYMVEPAPNAELVARFPEAALASKSAAARPGSLARDWNACRARSSIDLADLRPGSSGSRDWTPLLPRRLLHRSSHFHLPLEQSVQEGTIATDCGPCLVRIGGIGRARVRPHLRRLSFAAD